LAFGQVFLDREGGNGRGGPGGHVVKLGGVITPPPPKSMYDQRDNEREKRILERSIDIMRECAVMQSAKQPEVYFSFRPHTLIFTENSGKVLTVHIRCLVTN
jgi:hypothetical protein